MSGNEGDWNYGGQRANMEDESMRGTLAAQAQVIWPAERAILERRYGKELGCVLDLACGTGEILGRLRREFDCSRAIGIDLFDGHLRYAEPPVVRGDGYLLPFADETFDLVLVRHVLQALPDPVGLLADARRVLRPGGRIHVVAEDYLGLFFDDEHDPAVENHFLQVQPLFRAQGGTDLYQGRRSLRHLRAAGFQRIAIDPLFVDNLTADRDAFARIFRYWGEGYAATLAALTGSSVAEMERRFVRMAANAADPDRYCAWLLFALDGSKS